MFKNKRKKITAIAAAALCFSSNIKTSNAQEVIIVSDGGGVVLDPVKNTEHDSEKDSDSGVSSLLWPAALAAVGGLVGTLAGNKSSPKGDDKDDQHRGHQHAVRAVFQHAQGQVGKQTQQHQHTQRGQHAPPGGAEFMLDQMT